MAFTEPKIAGNKMTFDEFQVHWPEYWRSVIKEQRRGQALSNYLHMVRPDLSTEVHKAYCDPFYEDERIDDCLDFLTQIW
jgi:hypothetical protein